MAVTITTPTPHKKGWILNATSADASGGETLRASPGAGLRLVVDEVVINNGAGAQSITIGQGLTGAAVTVALIGPIAMAANTSLVFNFRNGVAEGLALDAATALTLDSTSNTALCVFVKGRTE